MPRIRGIMGENTEKRESALLLGFGFGLTSLQFSVLHINPMGWEPKQRRLLWALRESVG